MKNLIKKLFALMVVILMVSSVQVVNAEFYSTLFRITDIDLGLVTVMDCNGNLFLFEDEDDWMVGDFLTAVMNDCGTESILDDEIVSVRYERVDLFE